MNDLSLKIRISALTKAHIARYRIIFFCLALLVLIVVPTRPVGVADGLPTDHPLDLWIALLLGRGVFHPPLPDRAGPGRRLLLALLVIALCKIAVAAATLPHGLAARYYANADFEGPHEAYIEYRLYGAPHMEA